MKKKLSLLLIVFITFFSYSVIVHAEMIFSFGNTTTAFGSYQRKVEQGEKVYFIPSIFDISTNVYCSDGEIIGSFDSQEDKVFNIKLDNGFDTSSLIPNYDYVLTQLDVTCNGKHQIMPISPNAINYISYSLSNNRIYVQEKGPINNKNLSYTFMKLDGEKIEFKMETSSNNVSNVRMLFEEEIYGDQKDSFSVPVDKKSNDTYEIDLSKASKKPKYSISYGLVNLWLTVDGKDYSYSKKENDSDSYYFSPYFTIRVYEELINNFSIETNKAKLNDDLFIKLDKKYDVKTGTLYFKNINNEKTLTLTIKDPNNNPHVSIPYTAAIGDYKLEKMTLTSDAYKVYSSIDKSTKAYYYFDKELYDKEYKNPTNEVYEYMDFNYMLNIEKDDGTIKNELLELENDGITSEIIDDIKKINEAIEINIDASKSTKVKKEVFDAIKGTNKALNIKNNDIVWSFKGKDINLSTDLDTAYSIKSAPDEISKKVDNALVIKLNNTKRMPGDCTIKINNNDTVSKTIKGENINIYYYDEDVQKFSPVTSDIKRNKDGYYEVKISLSDDLVITNNIIKDKYIVGKGGISIVLIIVIVLLVLVAAGVAVIIIRKKKNKKKNDEVKIEENKEEEKVDTEEPIVNEESTDVIEDNQSTSDNIVEDDIKE